MRSCRSTGEEAIRLSRELARKEGIFAGISAGATLAGALELQRAPRRARTSFACCRIPASAISRRRCSKTSADMTEEEIDISRSTPRFRFDTVSAATAAVPTAPATLDADAERFMGTIVTR